MPGQPAARVGDGIICPVPQLTPAALPHAPPPKGLPIVPPGALTVRIGNQAAARIGDHCMCLAPVPVPNPILKGAFPVRIENAPAARVTDPGTHQPGSVIAPPCCLRVLIGLAGTSGNPWAGKEECLKAQAGRQTPGADKQSAENCGVESCRQILNRVTKKDIKEIPLLQWAMRNRLAERAATLADSGRTTAAQRAMILSRLGVPVGTVPSTSLALETAVGKGQGAIVGVKAGTLWAPHTRLLPGTGGHAVVVTGVEYDDRGNPVNVIINDTGKRGRCGYKVPYATFRQARREQGTPLVITRNPIW